MEKKEKENGFEFSVFIVSKYAFIRFKSVYKKVHCEIDRMDPSFYNLYEFFTPIV